MTSPHIARDLHHRRAVAARVPAVETSLTPVAPSVVPRKRANKRCKVNSSSSISIVTSTSVSVPTTTEVSTSSVDVQPTAAPVNVGGALPSFSSSPVEPSSSSTFVAPAPTSSAAPSSSKAAPVKPSTTSEAPAPPPTTTSVAPPKPTTTSAAPGKPTTTSAAPPPATSTPASSGGDSLLTATHTGDATFYATGLGACGIVNTDSDFIVAVSKILFDSFPGYNGANPNNNPICNKKGTATYNGNKVSFTITDRCEACDEFSLDFSPTAFDVLADPSIGRLHDMKWTFDN
ncbi:hypothetical protein PHLCEN_2v569 [Hermanssonia centrifuga]|uniref:Uncharacterized protein n=1 Tax=Hermanssonia centrifuga TaxID=98765 RepID=A0A2R6S5M0_9APHY|nr:hypothetical protein PHLCEN_2v569 [Hermanssonia centrifuga]